MSHYYTEKPNTQHDEKEIVFNYRGIDVPFITDSGVFCKDRVDFGTQLMLNSLPEDISGDVLDLGCGWGPVGICISKYYDNCNVTMVDINERAVNLAKRNARTNGVTANVFKSDGLSNVSTSFDAILLNPPVRAGKSTYFPWFEACYNLLNDNGRFYCVVQKKQGAPSVKKQLQALYGNCEIIARSAGFHVMVSIKG